MTRFVIDARVLLELLDRGVSVDSTHQLVAPSSLRSEALQILLDEVRRGERTEKEALAVHERMTELKIRLLGDRVSRRTAWRFALDHDVEDIRAAEYVAVARLQADALVTADPQLARQAEGVVRVASLDDLLAAPA